MCAHHLGGHSSPYLGLHALSTEGLRPASAIVPPGLSAKTTNAMHCSETRQAVMETYTFQTLKGIASIPTLSSIQKNSPPPLPRCSPLSPALLRIMAHLLFQEITWQIFITISIQYITDNRASSYTEDFEQMKKRE